MGTKYTENIPDLTVNQLVVGSIPTVGANEFKGLAEIQLGPFSFGGTLGAQILPARPPFSLLNAGGTG